MHSKATAGMGAHRRSPAHKQHLGLPGGAAGAMDVRCQCACVRACVRADC